MKIQSYTGFALVKALKAHTRRAEQQLSQLGLRAGQEILLSHLWEEEGLTQGDIAKRMGIEQPTSSIILQRMEAAGFVVRHTDDHDGRVMRVYLTEKGRQAEQPVRQIWMELEEATLAGMTEPERLLLHRLLNQIRENLA